MFTALGSAIALIFSLLLRGASAVYRDRKIYAGMAIKWLRNLAIFYGLLFLGLMIGFISGNGVIVSVFSCAISLTALGTFLFINSSKRFFLKKENFSPAYGLGLIAMIFAFIPILWYTSKSAFAGAAGLMLFLGVCLIIIWWAWGGMTQVNPLQVPRAILIISTILVMVYGASIAFPIVAPTQTRLLAAWFDLADTKQNVYAAGVEEDARFVTTKPIKPLPLFDRTTTMSDGKEVVSWDYVQVVDANGAMINWVIPTTQEIKARNPKMPLFSAEGEQMFEVQLPDQYGLYAKSTKTYYAPCRFTQICNGGSTSTTSPKSDNNVSVDPKWDGVTSTNLKMAASGIFPTGIRLKKGQQVRIRANGSVNASSEATKNDLSYKWVGANGWQNSPSFNVGRKGPLPAGQSFMALAGRISSSSPSISDQSWSLVGAEQVLTATQDGELYLAVNDMAADSKGSHAEWFANNQGGLDLDIQVI